MVTATLTGQGLRAFDRFNGGGDRVDHFGSLRLGKIWDTLKELCHGN
jgi:hypothetical protein